MKHIETQSNMDKPLTEGDFLKEPFLTILWLGIMVIVLMCLFPPWVQTVRPPIGNSKSTEPAGYAFLWQPPDISSQYQEPYRGVEIDYSRLLLQIFVVGLIMGGLMYTSKVIQKLGKPPDH